MFSELRSGGYNSGNWHFEDGVYYKGDSGIDVAGIVNETLVPKNFSEGAEVEIEVPYQMKFDRVSVYTNLGEIEISGLQSEFIYPGSDLGDIDYSSDAMVLEAETDMGNIELEVDFSE